MMILFVLFYILITCSSLSQPEHRLGGIVLILLPIFFIVVAVVCALNDQNPTPPPREEKRRNQTEDEFNEMAITTLYANQWLDEDNNDD